MDYLRVTFSNWLWEGIFSNFVSGQSFSKPSWLNNITKIPVAFKSELETKFGAYAANMSSFSKKSFQKQKKFIDFVNQKVKYVIFKWK